jgi:hypothetical protein
MLTVWFAMLCSLYSKYRRESKEVNYLAWISHQEFRLLGP